MSEDRKRQILETSYEIVATYGLEALHARTVATKIGINHAAVHYYFRTREDLLMALADHVAGLFNQDFDRFRQGGTGGQAIEATLAQFEAYSRLRSRYIKVWVSLYVASLGNDVLRDKIESRHLAWTSMLADHLEKSETSREVRSKSPFKNADLLAASLFGLAVLGQVSKSDKRSSSAIDIIAESLLK